MKKRGYIILLFAFIVLILSWVVCNLVQSNVDKAKKVAYKESQTMSSDQPVGDAMAITQEEVEELFNTALELGILSQGTWSSIETLDMNKLLQAYEYTNQPRENIPEQKYFTVDESTVEEHFLKYLDIEVTRLHKTEYYENGVYKFKVLDGLGGHFSLHVREYTIDHGNLYVYVYNEIDENYSAILTVSNGKFVSYVIQ